MEAFKLRDYQVDLATKGVEILRNLGLLYLAFEPRVGKTSTSFEVARLYGARNVIFITRLKAMSSVDDDYKKMRPPFYLQLINHESLHKVDWDRCDLLIVDEAHRFSGYAKPSAGAKKLKELAWQLPIIYLSGTPAAESHSQFYHQFWVSMRSPFAKYKNFYLWARDFVNVKKRYIHGGIQINDYSEAKKEAVMEAVRPYILHFTQKEAGFTSFVQEEIVYVDIDVRMFRLIDVLKKDKVYRTKSGHDIVADTPVRLQSIMHQLCSGTIKVDDKTRLVLDESKAWYIRSRFAGQKIAVYHKFIAEGDLLRKVFPNHTSDQDEFNRRDDLVFIIQMVTGREGVNISTADALIAYNIDFSANTYWQFRERMQTKDRIKISPLYWLFSKGGIEDKVYKAVVEKKDYNLAIFEQDYGIKKLFRYGAGVKVTG